MKRLVFLLAIMFCGVAFAQTIRWHIGDTVYQTTTCNAGESITPPTAPEKFGYSFREWAEYSPIEYLDISQGSFITVKYSFNIRCIFETKLSILANMVKDNGLFGNDWKQQSLLVVFDNNNKFLSYFSAGSGVENTKIITKDTPYILTVGNGFIIVDDFTVIGTPLNSLSVSTLRIPYSRVSGTFRLFYFKIYDNDILVRDFIPILDKNGTPCMYDKVEGKFYYNAGTGQFIAGPVI